MSTPAVSLIRSGDNESAAKLLTEMGALAMENGLRRQLGRALHLLGELHVRRGKPELGTQHLSEAFACFMGFGFLKHNQILQTAIEENKKADNDVDINVLYKPEDKETYIEEAEQSRLMMAISAGQEIMVSYFNLLREAKYCSVAKIKTIEWKLSHAGWWIHRKNHELIPCLCSVHNRTPLDIIRIQLHTKESMERSSGEFSEDYPLLERADTVEDLRNARSSFQN